MKPVTAIPEPVLDNLRTYARLLGTSAAARDLGLSRPTLAKVLSGGRVARHVAMKILAKVGTRQ